MTTEKEKIAEFYNGHAQQVQGKVGVNIRHRSIMRRLERAGLRSEHHVLEVGCGIGTLTRLLAKTVRKGSILAVDISPAAIDMGRKVLSKHEQVKLQVSDMSDFHSDRKFNMIVLPDVLEHIPEDQHDRLFRTLEAHLAPGGTICIHIPDPTALDWMRKERPNDMQIIDQSLPIGTLVERFGKCDLVLERFERYGLWTREPDYDWIEFKRPTTEVKQTKWSYPRAVFNEILSRLGIY